MKKAQYLWGAIIASLLLVGLAIQHRTPTVAQAQTGQVTIMDFAFAPATLTVAPGTTVSWTNQGPTIHTATSNTGVWDSHTLKAGASFSFTFKQAGTYSYHCSIHPGMKAQIIVQSSSPEMHNSMGMGPTHAESHPAFQGFYDAHRNTYLSTDVSNKAQATAMGINYAPGLANISDQHAPAIYLVEGRSAESQIAVFGSQPGETDYSPLWREVVIRWKSGVKPKLLTSDNQILALAKHHKLTMHATHIILNCPITQVGKG